MLELNQTKHKLLEPPTGPTLRSKLCFLIPVFIAAMILGFFIELMFFERISLQKVSSKLRDTYLLSQSQYESEESTYNLVKLQKTVNENLYKNKVMPLTWEDDQTLLDIENFSFLTNNELMCNVDEDNDNILLILVASERSHFMERKTIRQTYGSFLKLEEYRIRVVFLLGITPEIQIDANPFSMDNETWNSVLEKENLLIREENELISNESFLYGDIVVGNFIESLTSQNSYRHIMGYKWVLNFCSNARYVFKVDDNVFVNLQKLISQNELSFDTDFICKTFYFSPADCDICLDHGKYTKFCSGHFYGVNVEWIYKMYSVSHRYPLVEIDDVFITGLLREKAERDFKVNATIAENIQIYRYKKKDLCSGKNNRNWTDTQSVIYLQRDENLTKNFICLWNNSTVESINKKMNVLNENT